MSRALKDIAFIVLLLITATGLFFVFQHFMLPAARKNMEMTHSEFVLPGAARYPVAEKNRTAAESQPNVADFASTLSLALENLFGKNTFNSLLQPGDLIRDFVVTIDSLTGSRWMQQYSPVKMINGSFLVDGAGDELRISKKNFRRYDFIVKAAESIDLRIAVKVYTKYYPLIQHAYADLGQNKYFNDRFVDVIDDLLTAPVPMDRLFLNKTALTYKFADPRLESLDIGKKILIRMGPSNEEKAKNFLKALREKLVNLNS